MPAYRPFDPDRVAYFETERRRAYYHRHWPLLRRRGFLLTMRQIQ